MVNEAKSFRSHTMYYSMSCENKKLWLSFTTLRLELFFQSKKKKTKNHDSSDEDQPNSVDFVDPPSQDNDNIDYTEQVIVFLC